MQDKSIKIMLAGTALAVILAAGAAAPPPPRADISPASALDALPSAALSNGLLSAKVYLPVPSSAGIGFYHGTRFDHAGVVTHLTYKGQDYGQYWFSETSPDVHDFTYDGDQVVVSPASGAAGPVEEFTTIGFDEAGMGGNFLKIGVGMLKRDNEKYDFVHTYPLANEGKRASHATKDSVRFTQNLSDPSGYGYHYVKIVRLVPGKPQMTIEHVLTNTGKKALDTSVYCHNFLSLSPGNAHIEHSAPFTLVPAATLDPKAAVVDGKTLRYLRPIAVPDTVSTGFSGFGDTAADYDFRTVNTETGFGVRTRADQPLLRINMWSIAKTFSWEPYIAISLKPGQTKRWTYTYDYFAKGE